MSVGVEGGSKVLNLVGTRKLNYQSIVLRRPLEIISGEAQWQWQFIARLAIQVTPFVRQGFTLSRFLKDANSCPPQLVVTDEAATDAMLSGKILEEIAQDRLGKYAVRDYRSEPVILGKAGPFVSLFEPHKGALAAYMSTEIDQYGRVKLHGLSPDQVYVHGDWSGAFTPGASILLAEESQEAKVIPFPSKSTS